MRPCALHYVGILMCFICCHTSFCNCFSIEIASAVGNAAYMRTIRCQTMLGLGEFTQIDFWVVLRNDTEWDAIIEPEDSPTGYFNLHFQVKYEDGKVKDVLKRNVDFHYVPDMKPIVIGQGSSVCLGVALIPEIWDGADCDVSHIKEIKAFYTGVLFLHGNSLYASPADICAGKVFPHGNRAALQQYQSSWRDSSILVNRYCMPDYYWSTNKRKTQRAYDTISNDDIIIDDVL